MSYMDELRERFLAAEQRFGQINEAGREYRDRLMGLMSRIEEEFRCRRDVEQQQTQEIARLAAENESLAGENEQLRTMMMSLLTAVENGDPDSLGGTLSEMDTKVATLIGEGQGAVAPPAPADSPAEPVGDTPDFTAEFADDFADDLEEEEPFSAPSFPAGDMMSVPGDEPPFSGEDADFDEGDDSGSGEMVAEEAVHAEESPDAEADAPRSDETADVAESMPADSKGNADSDMAEFYGSGDQADADADAVPAYSHAVAGWEDFLDDEAMAPEAPAPSDDAKHALSEVSDDFVGEDAGDPEAGSIHELIDRVKTVVDRNDEDAEAGDDQTTSQDSSDNSTSDESGEDDDDGGKAAAQ